MVKSKTMKKLLIAAMSMSLVLAPVTGANASSVSGNSGASVSGNTGESESENTEEPDSEYEEETPSDSENTEDSSDVSGNTDSTSDSENAGNSSDVSGNTDSSSNSESTGETSGVSGNTGTSSSEGSNDSGEEQTSSGGGTIETAVEVPSTSEVRVNGVTRVTSVRGAYMSQTFQGTVVSTGRDALGEAYGVENPGQLYIRIYDISEKNTPAAMASIEAAAEAVGGSVIGAVNMEIGSLENGGFTLLDQDGEEITMIFGIPQNQIQEGYAYAMICVRPGGTIEVLPDLDIDPATVTFQMTGGIGAYAMIMYPAA